MLALENDQADVVKCLLEAGDSVNTATWVRYVWLFVRFSFDFSS